MLTPATKTFNGYKVTFIPLPLLDASVVDTRVASLVMPLLELLDTTDLSKMDINLKVLGNIMARTLSGLSRDAQTSLIVDSLRGCTISGPGQPAVEVVDASSLNQALNGAGLDTLYQVLFESWRYNKLSPFALVARFGLKIPETPTSKGPQDEASPHGIRLAR